MTGRARLAALSLALLVALSGCEPGTGSGTVFLGNSWWWDNDPDVIVIDHGNDHERPDRPNRPDRPERPDRPARPDRPGRPDISLPRPHPGGGHHAGGGRLGR